MGALYFFGPIPSYFAVTLSCYAAPRVCRPRGACDQSYAFDWSLGVVRLPVFISIFSDNLTAHFFTMPAQLLAESVVISGLDDLHRDPVGPP